MKKLFVKILLATTLVFNPGNISARETNALSFALDRFLFGPSVGYFSILGNYGDKFNPGVGYGFIGLYHPRYNSLPFLKFEGGFSYSNFSMKENNSSTLSELAFHFGPMASYGLSPYFTPFIGLYGGTKYMMLEMKESSVNETAFKPFAMTKIGFMSEPFSPITLKFEGVVSAYQLSGNIYRNYGFNIAAMTRFSVESTTHLGRKESLVQVTDIHFNPVYGAHYGIYKDNAIGKVYVENVGRNPLSNVRILISIKEIADNPTPTKSIDELKPGEKVVIEIPVAFSSKILEVREPRDFPATLKIQYGDKRGIFSYTEHETILVHPKNSITWDNTKHIGSFITPADEPVSSFARSTVSEFKNHETKGIPRKIQQAAFLFDSLAELGIAYVRDPNRDFAKQKGDGKDVDFVLFPRELMAKRAGDCDDLTALYASLLESVGIHTAAATVPGHIFLLFDTEIPEKNYREICPDREMLHMHKGTAWIPIEVTMAGKPFTEAWKIGANAIHREGFEVVEISEAWKNYPPADIGPGKALTISFTGKTVMLFSNDVQQIKKQGYDLPLQKHIEDLAASPENPKLHNAIGILHGRFGKLEEAETSFKMALKYDENFSPGYANLGNIRMLKKDFKKAVHYYEKAIDINPDNSVYLIALSRAYHETGNRIKSRKTYEMAIKKTPAFYKQFSYLASESKDRASDNEERLETHFWSDDNAD